MRLLLRTVEYELRKAVAFRVGFLVREFLRGVSRPVVMVFVFGAIFSVDAVGDIRGWDYPQIVAYMILAATLDKLVFHERGLDISEQIFEGYITKYLVMPVNFFLLPLGRWVQFTLLQLVFAALFWSLGWLIFPSFWPVPVGVAATLQALALVLLGSYCCFLLYFVVHTLAFWLDVVWSLLVMVRFVIIFVSGLLIPISMMPDALQSVLRWTFPYWMLSAPIEIALGRLGTDDFLRGLICLGVSALVIDRLRALLWRRGTRSYTAGGM